MRIDKLVKVIAAVSSVAVGAGIAVAACKHKENKKIKEKFAEDTETLITEEEIETVAKNERVIKMVSTACVTYVAFMLTTAPIRIGANTISELAINAVAKGNLPLDTLIKLAGQ